MPGFLKLLLSGKCVCVCVCVRVCVSPPPKLYIKPFLYLSLLLSLLEFVSVTSTLIQACIACCLLLHVNTSHGMLTPLWNINSLCRKRSMDRRWIEGKAMVQWMILHRNDSFVNRKDYLGCMKNLESYS